MKKPPCMMMLMLVIMMVMAHLEAGVMAIPLVLLIPSPGLLHMGEVRVMARVMAG